MTPRQCVGRVWYDGEWWHTICQWPGQCVGRGKREFPTWQHCVIGPTRHDYAWECADCDAMVANFIHMHEDAMMDMHCSNGCNWHPCSGGAGWRLDLDVILEGLVSACRPYAGEGSQANADDPDRCPECGAEK